MATLGGAEAGLRGCVGSNPPLHSDASAGSEDPASVRARLSGGEEPRPVTATQYKYDIARGGWWGLEAPSVEQLQVSNGNSALLVASLAHQPIGIHPRDAADRDHLQ